MRSLERRGRDERGSVGRTDRLFGLMSRPHFGWTGARMKPGTQYRQQAFGASCGGSHMTITARYEDGVFKPLEDVTVNEGTIVEVRVPSYTDRLKGKSRPVGDCAFFGMWKDRTDI